MRPGSPRLYRLQCFSRISSVAFPIDEYSEADSAERPRKCEKITIKNLFFGFQHVINIPFVNILKIDILMRPF